MTSAPVAYVPGDAIRVTDGPFTDLCGIVRQVDRESGQLLVDVTMFGSLVPIRTEPYQVARSQPVQLKRSRA